MKTHRYRSLSALFACLFCIHSFCGFTTLRPSLEGSKPGLEEQLEGELTPEKIREQGALLQARFQPLLDELDRRFNAVFLPQLTIPRARRALAQSRIEVQLMRNLMGELRLFRRVFEDTVKYEIGGSLIRMQLALDAYNVSTTKQSDEDWPDEDWAFLKVLMMRDETQRIRGILRELAGLREVRLATIGHAKVLVLRSSRAVLPEWFLVNRLHDSGPFLSFESRKLIFTAAEEAGADGVLLVSLPIGEKPVLPALAQIQPYARSLHPDLPRDLFKGIQVKGLLAVDEEVTGVRYLAILGAGGLEEVTLEQVRPMARRLNSRVAEQLEDVEALLDTLAAAGVPEEEKIEGVMLAVHLLSAETKKEITGLSGGPFRNTFLHELQNPLTTLFVYSSVMNGKKLDTEFFLRNLLAMKRNLLRIRWVLQEMASLEHARLTVLGGIPLLALESSETTHPRWFELDGLSNYGEGLLREVNKPGGLAELAKEAGVNQVMLIPLSADRRDVLRIQPYAYREPDMERAARYFAGANTQLSESGIQYREVQAPYPGRLDKLGFIISSGELPPNIAPAGYRTLDAGRFDPDSPARYHPLLPAMAALYPQLKLEFLEAEIRLTVVVEDSVTGARYLAVLA